MSVNARTFQILYVIRRRALGDEGPTTPETVSTFIANRRKNGPDTYSKAYISPSALNQMLSRMSTVEGLLEFESKTGSYGLSVKGSQMADLLVSVDACSVTFFDNYKREVCMAVLEQRQRLQQVAASPREVAAIANISLDSARRGLAALTIDKRAIEDRSARTPTYAAPPDLAAIFTATNPGAPAQRKPSNSPIAGAAVDLSSVVDGANKDVAALLADIDEGDPLVPGDTPVVAAKDEDDMAPVPLSLVLDDEGTDDEGGASDDEVEAADPHALGQSITVEAHEPDDEKADPLAWATVSDATRGDLIAQAKGCGLDLNSFLSTLAEANAGRMRLALHHTVKFG